MNPEDENNKSHFEKKLEEADSPFVLAPEGYDDDKQEHRAEQLCSFLRNVLTEYQFTPSSKGLYQDGTGLAAIKVSAGGAIASSGPDPIAWILLSHFGNLTTIVRCEDHRLLRRIRKALQDFGMDWVDYSFLDGTIYHGKCKALVGLNYLNRFFSIAPTYNEEFLRKSLAEKDS